MQLKHDLIESQSLIVINQVPVNVSNPEGLKIQASFTS